MKVTPKQDKQCHQVLPIDSDEKVLAIYKHHGFVYVLPLLTGGLVIVILMGLATLLSSQTFLGGAPIVAVEYQKYVYGTAIVLSVLTAIFTFIPVWLRSQEYIVLTDEAVLQVLQPALFANKVSQTSLEGVSDVSVRQDFWGTMLGYGKLSIETPGEQDNYEYKYLPQPREAAREIIEAHEDFSAALQSGRLPTSLGSAPSAEATKVVSSSTAVSVDAAEYQAFLRFQQQQSAQQPPQGVAQEDSSQAGPSLVQK